MIGNKVIRGIANSIKYLLWGNQSLIIGAFYLITSFSIRVMRGRNFLGRIEN